MDAPEVGHHFERVHELLWEEVAPQQRTGGRFCFASLGANVGDPSKESDLNAIGEEPAL